MILTKCSSFKARRARTKLVCAVLALLASVNQLAEAERVSRAEPDGTVHVPAFLLPESSLLDDKTRAALEMARSWEEDKAIKAALERCAGKNGMSSASKNEPAECQLSAFYDSVPYKQLRKRYSVTISTETIGGVDTEIFEPAAGISQKNKSRVLINLHGGHFKFGSRRLSHAESVPIAAVGKIRVISVDYRLAPDHKFPAASEDVAAVYVELLKRHEPENIGIFGCSAGGLLTAQSIAWLLQERLPLPGAIGIFGAGASYYQEGDSVRWVFAMGGHTIEPPSRHAYFGPEVASDPLAFPIESTAIMAKFPPSLLLTSTRDLALSSAVHTHSTLIRLRRVSDLHVWEGLGHCFFNGGPFPETDEANEVIVRFFDKHLGT